MRTRENLERVVETAAEEEQPAAGGGFSLLPLALFLALILLYVASSIPTGVLFVNGFFMDKPRTRQVLEIAYAPLGIVLQHSQSLMSGYNSMVECLATPQYKKR